MVLPSGDSTSTTCLASSRVGTSTRAVGWPGLACSTVCSIGRPNASVLPEPVRALPHTSRPARESTIVASWMAKGSSMPWAARASTNSARRPRSRKEVTQLSPRSRYVEAGSSAVPRYFGTNEVRPRAPKGGSSKTHRTRRRGLDRSASGIALGAGRDLGVSSFVHGVRDPTDARRGLPHHGAARLARGPSRRGAPGPAAGAGRGRRAEHAGASTSTASAGRTRARSTAPRTSRRSCCARTSSRPARSSRTTGRARSTCSASRASSCSTRSRARTCCASSATAPDLATEVARGQHRAMLAWCCVDPRLLPGVHRSARRHAGRGRADARGDRRRRGRVCRSASTARPATRRATSTSSRCGRWPRRRVCPSCCTSRARART